MSQYILFYSKKCKYSVNFINILHKINARGYFSFVTVDRNPQTGQRNRFVNQYQISQVPTIIVNDKKMVGAEAFQWLRSIIYDMGLKGPQSIDTRQNKDGSHINPQNFDEDEGECELEGFDNTDNNFMSVENTANSRIEYVPEDGETRRPSDGYNSISSQYQSILPADEARKLDIELLKTGRNSNDDNGYQKKRQGLKQDKLKEKQRDSVFEKYRMQRDSEIPQPRRRM